MSYKNIISQLKSSPPLYPVVQKRFGDALYSKYRPNLLRIAQLVSPPFNPFSLRI